jgi:glycerate kinase
VKAILIAPNSFKECASSVETATLMYNALKKYTSEFQLIMKPISDGGDGFLEVCKYYFGGELLDYRITVPFDDSMSECPVLYNSDRKKIFIESADVLGLKILPQRFRKPMQLSSKGIGELLLQINEDVNKRKILVDDIVIGIGGTGTIDLGLGMCSQLGLSLIDEEGKVLDPLPLKYKDMHNIQIDKIHFPFSIECVVDVNNPLIGTQGAAHSFGSQKGASEDEIQEIDNSFSKVINILKNNNLVDSSIKLSGAGGGLAAAFQIMFNSPLISSQDFVLNHLGLSRYIGESDYILTGEGVFDIQTFMGKGAGILVRQALANNKEVFLVCGRYLIAEKFNENFKVFELQEFFNSKEESIAKFEEGIDKVCEKIALSLK